VRAKDDKKIFGIFWRGGVDEDDKESIMRESSRGRQQSWKPSFGECNMKAFSFLVTIAAENLDTEVVVDSLRECMIDGLPEGTLAHVKADGIKNYSEQGYKVFRSRVFGIGVKDAGDGHNAKPAKAKAKQAEETVGA